MTIDRTIAAAFRMTDEVWERHANPWSVWTRFTALPLIIMAIWSRVWFGWWALLPAAAALLWTWLNPRIFARPRSTDNWASMAVLGERVWVNRAAVPVPARHRVVPQVLNAVSATGLPFVVWGLVAIEVWPTVLGTVIIYLGKLWFADRMVWLYEDMKDADPRYREWLY